MPAKCKLDEPTIMAEFLKYLAKYQTVPMARNYTHVSYKVLCRLKKEHQWFRDEINEFLRSKKRNYDHEFIICKTCGRVYKWQDYVAHRLKHKGNSISISTFRQRKSCDSPRCIELSRVSKQKGTTRLYTKADWGEKLTWTNYFDGELHYLYEDQDFEKSTANLLKQFSKDTELPISYLIKARNGDIMINRTIASLFREMGICYRVETIQKLQNKLYYKNMVSHWVKSSHVFMGYMSHWKVKKNKLCEKQEVKL